MGDLSSDRTHIRCWCGSSHCNPGHGEADPWWWRASLVYQADSRLVRNLVSNNEKDSSRGSLGCPLPGAHPKKRDLKRNIFLFTVCLPVLSFSLPPHSLPLFYPAIMFFFLIKQSLHVFAFILILAHSHFLNFCIFQVRDRDSLLSKGHLNGFSKFN